MRPKTRALNQTRRHATFQVLWSWQSVASFDHSLNLFKQYLSSRVGVAQGEISFINFVQVKLQTQGFENLIERRGFVALWPKVNSQQPEQRLDIELGVVWQWHCDTAVKSSKKLDQHIWSPLVPMKASDAATRRKATTLPVAPNG